MKTSNNKAGLAVKNMHNFEGSNLYGKIIKAGERIPYFCDAEYDTYIVYSYNSAILGYVNGVWYESMQKHSITTSKQKTQIKYYLRIDQQVKTEDELLNELKTGGLYGKLQKQLKQNNKTKKQAVKI